MSPLIVPRCPSGKILSERSTRWDASSRSRIRRKGKQATRRRWVEFLVNKHRQNVLLRDREGNTAEKTGKDKTSGDRTETTEAVLPLSPHESVCFRCSSETKPRENSESAGRVSLRFLGRLLVSALLAIRSVLEIA